MQSDDRFENATGSPTTGKEAKDAAADTVRAGTKGATGDRTATGSGDTAK